jgi:hypothetical protein
VKALPPWSGLRIGDKVMNVHFSDANKFRDILKVCAFYFVDIPAVILSFW